MYLFLVTVADARGLSFYADASVQRLLSLSPQRLETAREALLGAGLIAYEAPLYQVLALEAAAPAATRTSSRCATGELRSMREILHQAMEAQT